MSSNPSTASPHPTNALNPLRAWLLDFYSKTYFYNLRVGRKLLPMGKAVISVAAACFLMIWDPNKVGMRYSFSLCLATLLSALLINVIRQPRQLKFERTLPERVVEGALFDYTIKVTNEGKKHTPHLLCRDHGRLRFPSAKDWRKSTPPFDEQLNAFDRWIGYPKWIWLVDTLQDVIGFDFEIPPLPPGQSIVVRAQGRAGKRGKRIFLGFYCGLTDPLHLLQRLYYVHSRQTLLVLPKPLHSGIEIPIVSRSQNLGDSRDLRKSGDSEEFRSLRDWRSGDSMKRIDWKATARRGELVAREYAPEYKLRTALIFDTSLPPYLDEDAFEAAMGYAAGLVVSIERRDRNIDLLVLPDHYFTLSQGQGSHDHVLALEKLAACSPSSTSSLAQLEDCVLSTSAKFSSAVLVCPSWTVEHVNMAQRITASGIGLAVIVCSTPKTPEFPSGASIRVFETEHT